MSGYASLGLVGLVGLAFVAVASLGRMLLAPRGAPQVTVTTYESGVDPVGNGWSHVSSRYLGYAFLYVIFAVDALYLFPWAYALHAVELGRASLAEIGVFVGVLLIGLIHAARRGMLQWR